MDSAFSAGKSFKLQIADRNCRIYEQDSPLCLLVQPLGAHEQETLDAEVQNIADVNADGTADLLLRTASGVVGAALITGADSTTWAQYGALGAEWSTRGVGIL